MNRITVLCFGASYAVALGVELVELLWPRPVQRLIGLSFATAGLAAHTLFLAAQPLALATQFWSTIFLAWILAIFYLYGSLHHRRRAWGVFVLPLVLGLIALSLTFDRRNGGSVDLWGLLAIRGERFWLIAHVMLLLLAAVGVCVGFVSSLMYLIQARRLRAKKVPALGFRLLSLERLEAMNRRAIVLAFPLLTAGVLIGTALIAQRPGQFRDWTDPKIVGTIALWLVFALVFFLRHTRQVAGRQLALLTIVAFALLLFTLASSHPIVLGGPR